MNTTKERYEGDRTRKTDTTQPATQVGPRRVKSGLGGPDAGVSGVVEGVERSSFPLSKRGRLVLSDYPTFSGFVAKRTILKMKGKTSSRDQFHQTT